MSHNHHKKSQFGGALGAEFDRIWEAIRENRVVGTKGQRIKRTPAGTIIEQQSTAGSENETVEATGGATFLYDPFYTTSTTYWPTSGPPYESTKQLAVWMDCGVSKGGEQLVLLPPNNWNAGELQADGYFWPMDFADNQLMNCGGATMWIWYGKLEQGVTYNVTKLVDTVNSDTATGSNVTGTSYVAEKGENGATITHPTKINYFLDPNDPNLSSNGWNPC